MADCIHNWYIGEPRGEWRDGDRWHIANGRCLRCGAEKEFALNTDDYTRRGRNLITHNKSDTPRPHSNWTEFG